MYTVGEVAKLADASARMFHHYDALGVDGVRVGVLRVVRR